MTFVDAPKTPTWEITSEDVQRYARIGIYYASGYLTARGVDAGVITMLSGVALGLANFGWSLWGMRVNAKLSEIAKLGTVREVIVESHAMAAEIPSPKVVGPIMGR